MKMQIIKSSGEIVVLSFEGFKRLLQAATKKSLISEFAKLYSQQIGWKKLKKDEIIDNIIKWTYYRIEL